MIYLLLLIFIGLCGFVEFRSAILSVAGGIIGFIVGLTLLTGIGAAGYYLIKNPSPVSMSHNSNFNNAITTDTYHHNLKIVKNYDKSGIASWFGAKFDGKLTSTGATVKCCVRDAIH